ncbi:uncharacterized protein BDR25DRAFT_304987 [Lindgomyces ingoldianus]|uniref:Uncharacterized protein n=1 Tax=Lindgomyces ingoldianus TaxID=673940 RepID=A0ACB6QNW6_9PLEO|nr:uncharacterized protein BDR25DRAFT_304987 [Lindgomyces ingoldianus]KAF2468596.1 hypothetical protein BDR25DRAFT_304987 [Lindgomyces ingoldianus]
MTSFVPPIISPVLKEAAELKIEELNRVKTSFKSRYYANPNILAAGPDTLKRVDALLEEIKKLDPYLENDDDLARLARYVEQGKNDRSISQAKLQKLEKQLLDKLAIHAHRLDVSSLHVDLLREAMYPNDSPEAVSAKLEKATMEDEFEFLEEGELETAFEKFEKNTFASKQVDVEALEKYLSGLFQDNGGNQALERLREDIGDYGDDVMNGPDELDDETLEWCINDLIHNGLLSDERRKTLQGYLQSPIVLRELKSTLNAKSIRHWTWRNVDKGLPVTARKNSEGNYCITVEEEIIDMLFLHTLAIGWSCKLRGSLKDLVSNPCVWVRSIGPLPSEMNKREYYLLPTKVPKRAPAPRPSVCTVCHPPPPPPGPPPPPMNYGPPPQIICPPPPPPPFLKAKKKKKNSSYPPPPPFPMYGQILNEERYRNFSKHFFLTRLPDRDGSTLGVTPVQETQSELIKHLATELKVREALYGDVNIFSTNFESFGSSLPHQTILALLKFIGVPKLWLEVFTRFLEAPLNMGPVVRGTSDQILTRTCGVPVSHGMELFFGELTLFFLDFAIHQKTGAYLYRLRDRCYFVGKSEQCKMAEEAFFKFETVTGLRSGPSGLMYGAKVGFLDFPPVNHAPVTINIDNHKVEAYARRVKKQLTACTTVVDWIRTWNSTIGTYADDKFGPLANVFGKHHLDAVMGAYNRIHEIIFERSNLTDHVKQLLSRHIRPTLQDPPFALEPLIFLPTAYGGLGVKNPYITLNLAKSIAENPGEGLNEYIKSEDEYYNKAKETFTGLKADARDRKLNVIFGDDKERIAFCLGDRDPSVFMSKDELTAHREDFPYPTLPHHTFPSPVPFTYTPTPAITPVYNSLLDEPRDEINPSERIDDETRRLSGRDGMKNWWRMCGEDRWVVELYGEECFERYGGLELWHGDYVPLEVVKMVRGEDGDVDDDGSTSSYSLP